MTDMDAVNAAGDDSPESKLTSMLRVFLTGTSLNLFQAEEHHDHCLHSTVSTLENEHGIVFDRHYETVPCLRGRKRVRCMRYWLRPDQENVARAQAFLRRRERKK